ICGWAGWCWTKRKTATIQPIRSARLNSASTAMKTNKLVLTGAVSAMSDCQVQNAIRNGDITVPMAGRMSRPPIPFGPSVAVGEAAVVETSVMALFPRYGGDHDSQRRCTRLNKLFAARCGALHRLGVLDLDRAADALEHGGRRLDQCGDDPPPLLPALPPRLGTLPPGLPEEDRVGEGQVECMAQRRDPLDRHAGIGHDRARDHHRARDKVEHALLVGAARELAQERHLLEQREAALAGLDDEIVLGEDFGLG